MYAVTNYRTKKEFKAAVKASLQEQLEPGCGVAVHQPGGMFPGVKNGDATIEGPHYPEPHRWYARVRIKESVVVKFLG